MADTGQVASRSIRQLSVAGCAALYVAAFVATHLPPSRVPGGGLINDKILHLIGYAGLGLATWWAWSVGLRRGRSAGVFLGLWAIVLCYALVDELTQPIVGRSFEWGDLAADAVGALVGLSAARFFVRRRL